MNTCDTCKHWVARIEAELYTGIPIGKGSCEDVDTGEEDSFETIGFNDENSQLITGPKFGCIHWESK